MARAKKTMHLTTLLLFSSVWSGKPYMRTRWGLVLCLHGIIRVRENMSWSYRFQFS